MSVTAALPAALVALALLMTGCSHPAGDGERPLAVVAHVDVGRYMGVWHEIARYPHPFQKDCVASRATYSIRDDGKIAVLNECRNASPSGKLRSARATAWVVDPETNAKLKVSFFWPFSGHYWIIDLGKDYEYAVVGHPKRKYLWVLSRTETMEEPVYQGILDRLRAQHYDTERLMKTAPAKEEP
jgi:apolipoprotein D and lipocalin family protein